MRSDGVTWKVIVVEPCLSWHPMLVAYSFWRGTAASPAGGHAVPGRRARHHHWAYLLSNSNGKYTQ
jgi:hypothetical protein